MGLSNENGGKFTDEYSGMSNFTPGKSEGRIIHDLDDENLWASFDKGVHDFYEWYDKTNVQIFEYVWIFFFNVCEIEFDSRGCATVEYIGIQLPK